MIKNSLIVILFSDAPRLTVLPRDHRVDDGAIASFLCRASGNPVPEVYWRRAGRRIAVGRQRYTVVAVPLGGSLLRIEPVKAARDDDSAVECVAENGIGDPVSASARLHVYLNGQGSQVLISLNDCRLWGSYKYVQSINQSINRNL